MEEFLGAARVGLAAHMVVIYWSVEVVKGAERDRRFAWTPVSEDDFKPELPARPWSQGPYLSRIAPPLLPSRAYSHSTPPHPSTKLELNYSTATATTATTKSSQTPDPSTAAYSHPDSSTSYHSPIPN